MAVTCPIDFDVSELRDRVRTSRRESPPDVIDFTHAAAREEPPEKENDT